MPPTAKAIDYMLQRWPAFTRFLDDGRICLTNNAAEQALRGIAIGRKAWLFAGSGRGGERAASMFTLIETAKLNDVNPQARLDDVLGRSNGRPAGRPLALEPDEPAGQTGGKRSASRWPSSVSTTDFASPTGSEINPFLCSRSIASQSKLFQTRLPSGPLSRAVSAPPRPQPRTRDRADVPVRRPERLRPAARRRMALSLAVTGPERQLRNGLWHSRLHTQPQTCVDIIDVEVDC